MYFYPFQDTPAGLDVYVDTHFAGCSNSRRSTSGGVALYGGCNVKHWSKTQTTVALSSGEAELHGIAAGMAQGIGLQALAHDLGFEVTLTLHSDATAAIGIARRRGMGKIRHLDCTDLWIQEKIRSTFVGLEQIPGTEKPHIYTSLSLRMCAFKSSTPVFCMDASHLPTRQTLSYLRFRCVPLQIHTVFSACKSCTGSFSGEWHAPKIQLRNVMKMQCDCV